MNYFKKSDEDESNPNDGTVDPISDIRRNTANLANENNEVKSKHTEPDSTSKQIKNDIPKITPKKSSFSDTDLTYSGKEKRSKKFKLDVQKANQSLDDHSKLHNQSDDMNSDNPENTPKYVFLESKSSEAFIERVRLFDFSTSIDLDDECLSSKDNTQVESDDDISIASEESKETGEVKMCRKVSQIEDMRKLKSVSPESFGDMDIDKSEEIRLTTISDYQIKFTKMDNILKSLLNEFQYHIEYSKIFDCCDIEQDDIVVINTIGYDNIVPSSNNWDVVIKKEDSVTKAKFRNQLLTIKTNIEQFVNTNLKTQTKKSNNFSNRKKTISKMKKKLKHYDFPDYREALINLFSQNSEQDSLTTLPMEEKCSCSCHDSSDTDSGVTKSEERSMSITSSLGNFSLDSSSLTAYSESLDQIISYNSFQDTSVYSTFLQKTAVERIIFYVQVHSIQLKSEPSEDYESKSKISFHCPSCNATEYDENNLLKHILSQYHCEKLHFLYKTAYIKKCVQSGQEIQPSTVLNSMKLYRDDNKVVCFGDAVYACSLCFENQIIGESVLIAHCSEVEHVERREKLDEILD